MDTRELYANGVELHNAGKPRRSSLKLLFFTQKVDETDDVLGFVCGWIRALARRVERLHCICLETGVVPELGSNVTVHTLQKERGRGRLRLALESQRALGRLVLGGSVDAIFIHMAPLYTILAYPWAVMRRLPVFTWYTHRKVSLPLRLATALSDRVLTASPESFCLESPKVLAIGHGIAMADSEEPQPESSTEVLAVARVTPIKRLETLVEAATLLKDKGYRFRIVGDVAVPSDGAYRERLLRMSEAGGLSSVLQFEGAVAFRCMPRHYKRSLCSVNTCVRGSFDKVVLESMAMGIPAVTSNLSFAPLFGDDGHYLLFPEGDASALAERIEAIRSLEPDEKRALGERLRARVEREHGLARLMDRVVELYEQASQDSDRSS